MEPNPPENNPDAGWRIVAGMLILLIIIGGLIYLQRPQIPASPPGPPPKGGGVPESKEPTAQELARRIQELTDQLKPKTDNIAQLEQQIRELNLKLRSTPMSEAERQLYALNSEINEKNILLGQAQSRAEELQRQISQSGKNEQNRAAIQQQIDEKQSELAKLTNTSAGLTNTMEQMRNNIDTNKAKQVENDRQKFYVQEEISVVEYNIRMIKNEVSSSLDERTQRDLLHQKNEQEEDKRRLQARWQKLEAEHKKRRNEILALQARLEKTRSSQPAELQRVKQLREGIADLKAQLPANDSTALSQILQQAQTRQKVLTASLETLKQQRDQLPPPQPQIAGYQEQIDRLTQQLIQSQKEAEPLRSQLHEAELNLKMLREQEEQQAALERLLKGNKSVQPSGDKLNVP
jgi:chromosome segregation ATPase